MEQKEITNQMQSIIDFLQKYIAEYGYPPSVREIGESLQMKSTATVHYYLKKLEFCKVIRRSSNQNRCIELLPPYNQFREETSANAVSIPLVGKIAAGTPITAVENYEDIYRMPTNLFNYSGDLFMLQVAGESMIEAGIFDGDKVIIRKQNTVNNGEIVAALIQDEATLKRFYKEDGFIRLKPENSSMQDIIVQDATILGVAVGLVRNKI